MRLSQNKPFLITLGVILLSALVAILLFRTYITNDSELIVLLKDTPENAIGTATYEVCRDSSDDADDLIYKTAYGNGYDIGSTYYTSQGTYLGRWWMDDTTLNTSDGEIPKVENCQPIPEWFFNVKIDNKDQR